MPTPRAWSTSRSDGGGEPDRSRRDDVAALLAVLALALAVRLLGAGHPLLPDEGYTWLVASAPSPGAFLARLARYENTPAVYYLLAGAVGPDSPLALRIPSLLAGTALTGVGWALARRDLGRLGAAVAAMAIAVAPYAVAESDFARGYMLADLWLALCLWAALRLMDGAGRRWWWLYAVASTLALYTEYDAILSLLCIDLALVLVRRRRRRATLLGCAVPILAFVPWTGQLVRSLRDFRHTKLGLGYTDVSPGSVRDQLDALFLGHSGERLAPWERSVLVVGLGLLAAVAVALVLARGDTGARRLTGTVALVAAGTLLLHALAALAGVGIFDVAYLTFLLPLGAILLAAALGRLPRPAALGGLIALLALAVPLGLQRAREAPDIDVARIAAILRSADVHTVLTNSAVVAFSFRSDGVILDRPFDLGPGLVDRCGRCRRTVAIVDDADVGAGARPSLGPRVRVGHYVVVIPGVTRSARTRPAPAASGSPRRRARRSGRGSQPSPSARL